MKLFTKEVDKQLFAQYPKGSDLDNQMVVAKIFNPYGRGVWYLLNSDPQDPDYIWAIVDLFEPEIGSVSRSELQTIKVPPFGLGLERDIYFSPKPAKEVWQGIMKGERFARGGMTAGRFYTDNTGNEYRFIGESNGKLLFKDGEMVVTKSEEDFEELPREKKLFGFFEHGGEMDEEEEGVDLFEDYENIPDNVQVILDKYSEEFEDGSYKGLAKAKKELEGIGYTFEYDLGGGAYDLRKIGQKGKNEDEYAKGGKVVGRNNQTGESYGVVIGSVQKADEFDGGGIQMNVRKIYESRISESTLYFDNSGNLLSITDYGYGLEGNYPTTGYGSGTNYNADKKETLQVLSKKYNPAFAKKLIELAKGNKMEDGGFVEKTDEELKGMSDDELFEYLDAKAAYMKQYTRPLSSYKAKNFAANATAVQFKNEGTSKLDANFPNLSKINQQATKDYQETIAKRKGKMADGGLTDDEGNLIDLQVQDMVIEYKRPNPNQPKREIGGVGKILKISGAMANVVYPNDFEEWIPLKDLKKVDSKMAMGGKLNKIKYETKIKDESNDGKYYEKEIYANGILIAKMSTRAERYSIPANLNYTNAIRTKHDYKINEQGIKTLLGEEIFKNIKFNAWSISYNNKTFYLNSGKLSIKSLKDMINYANEDKMAMGGTTKFKDKVKAIKASLLKRKKVSPKVQKDYGKTYSPKEAEESAKRIAGSLRAKYELKKK